MAPLLALAVTVAPGGGCAAGTDVQITTLFGLLCRAQTFLNAVIPFLIALGVIYLVFGVVQYVIASDEEAKKKGRDRVVFGIIGLVVIIALWGLVRLVVNTLNISGNTTLDVPCVPGQSC